jgi:CheY-like chemotaxis protein
MTTDGKIRSKILVIDDDVEQAMAVKAILESRGYEVGTANNRASGMEGARVESPDLIILDVMMEGRQDGFEMARDLKKDPQCKDTPILMFTSIKEETGTDFKSAAGDSSWLPVDGYLDKTSDPEILLGEVEKLLAK